MRPTGRIVVLCAMLVFAAGMAFGDWFPGDPYKMHFPQMPDLSDTGVDVDATGIVLADDFQCTQSGPITDIHVWGSFQDDRLPAEGPGAVAFRLSIHADIPDPDGPGPEYSQPMNPPLWEKIVDPFTYSVRMEADNLAEVFWNPIDQGPPTPDTVCWQYNFDIPLSEAFYQQEGEIYWLDVEAWDPSGVQDWRWGWKTSLDHWNDDSVVENPPGSGTWVELRYPQGHPMEGMSMDQAFVITPEPTTIGLVGLAALAVLRRRKR